MKWIKILLLLMMIPVLLQFFQHIHIVRSPAYHLNSEDKGDFNTPPKISTSAGKSDQTHNSAAGSFLRKEHQVDNLLNVTSVSTYSTPSANDAKIAFITFSHMSDLPQFNATILAAAETWLPADATYYVVLNRRWEDTFNQWKQQIRKNTENGGIRKSAGLTRIQPIYVDCPEAKFGESPCCKQEQGLIQFHKTYYQALNYDWVMYMDDDMYVNARLLNDFIKVLPAGLPNKKEYIFANGKNPLLLLGNNGPPSLGTSGYLRKRSDYQCSKDEQFVYPWGGVVLYNKAAFEMVIPGLQNNGLVKQCLEYKVTHDVGNAIFHWMYSIPAVRFRVSNAKAKKGRIIKREDFIAYHGAGTSEEIRMDVFHKHRVPDEKVIFNVSSLPGEGYFGWFNVSGFQRTDTFKQFRNPQEWEGEWHTMPVSDCNK